MVVLKAAEAPTPTTAKPGNTSGDFPAVEEGIYPAEVKIARLRTRDTETNWPSFKTHDAEVNWGLQVTSGPHKNRYFWFDTELTLEAGSALRKTIKELIMHDELPADYEFDTDDLSDWEGLDCRIRVDKYYSNKYKEFRNSVKEILRPTDAMYEENPF